MLLIRSLINVSDFQNGLGAAGQVTLETEELVSHMRTAIVHDIIPLHDSDKEVIPILKVHDILDKTAFK